MNWFTYIEETTKEGLKDTEYWKNTDLEKLSFFDLFRPEHIRRMPWLVQEINKLMWL